MSSEQPTISPEELKALNLTKDDIGLIKGVRAFIKSKVQPKSGGGASKSSGGKKSEHYKTLNKFVSGIDTGKQKIEADFKDKPDEMKKALDERRQALRSACSNLTGKESPTYNDIIRVFKASGAVALDVPKPEAPAKKPKTN